MHLNCTAAVTRALEAAQRLARQQQLTEVASGHVLAGLVQNDEGAAAGLLARLGLELSAVRRALHASTDLHATKLPAPLLPWGRRNDQALARAQQLAGAVSADRTVTGPQLLLALLETDTELIQFLTPLGLDPTRLEAELRACQPGPLPLDEPLELLEPSEQIDAARLLDASANRAREALRVVEDYCRFALDDAFLTRALKQLRHDLTRTLNTLPGQLLLEARATLQDVGTSLSTAQERERHSLREVVQANLKRLQEALRSLEEVGKLFGPDLGQALEQLRYQSYTLERAILLGATARQRLSDARLYVLLTGSRCLAALDWTIQEAAAGGATVFQLREQDLDDRGLLERARQVRCWTRAAGVLFIVNNRPDIARLAEADGVHLGRDDMTVKDARRIVGPDALIGVSTHNLAQLRQAILDGASYVGVGPTFPSGTKQFDELAGLDFVRAAMAETSLPAFVIGGVTCQNISSAVAAGARRVAVSQAICQAEEPRKAAAELVKALVPNAPSGRG